MRLSLVKDDKGIIYHRAEERKKCKEFTGKA
jgi:hypothetical protein